MKRKKFAQKKSPLMAIALLTLAITMGVFLFLRPEEGTSKAPPPADVITASYSDGISEVEASFDNKDQSVTFTHPKMGTTTLPAAISASGARYANSNETIVFWEHQGELTITQNGVEVFRGEVETSDK